MNMAEPEAFAINPNPSNAIQKPARYLIFAHVAIHINAH